jgi:hypothetical protein
VEGDSRAPTKSAKDLVCARTMLIWLLSTPGTVPSDENSEIDVVESKDKIKPQTYERG